MRKLALALAGTAALLASPALQARDRVSGEEQLARMLEGRVAERPVSCISLHRTSDSRVIDKTAIVYGRGSVIYVNRPRDARSLDSNDVMVTKLHSSQLCRLDIVHLHERSQFFSTGFVGLDDFVPYRRIARNN